MARYLHEGKHEMAESSLRPFVGVGIAYFIIAVIVPIIMLQKGKRSLVRWWNPALLLGR
jgi:hypothetical protein